MKIKWFGHSCFKLTSKDGISILTDPFDSSVGYDLPKERVDIVTVSHKHRDHSDISYLPEGFVLINEPGSHKPEGIDIKGIPVFHDELGGKMRGKNIIFNIMMDGLNICHCGDIGHMLDEEQMMQLGEIDILLIPVGGFFTINHKKAYELAMSLSPKLVIPMHFKTDRIRFPIKSEGKFIKRFEAVTRAGSQEIEVTAKSISDQLQVVVLDYE